MRHYNSPTPAAVWDVVDALHVLYCLLCLCVSSMQKAWALDSAESAMAESSRELQDIIAAVGTHHHPKSLVAAVVWTSSS